MTKQNETTIPECSLARLLVGVGDFPAGTVGTVVHVYPNGAAYLVEFDVEYPGDSESEWRCRVVTVGARELEQING